MGQLVKQIQKINHPHPSFKEELSEATIKPLTGIPIALVVIYLTFTLIRFIGEWLIANVTEPFFYNSFLSGAYSTGGFRIFAPASNFGRQRLP